MYRLSEPDRALTPYIAHYWHVHATAHAPFDLSVDVFVDARADLIFNAGVPYSRQVIGGASRRLHASNLDAQRLAPIRIEQRGRVQVAGVRFLVGGLMPFLRGSLDALTNRVVGLAEAFGPDAVRLDAQLAECSGDALAQRALLDAFFLNRLDERPAHDTLRALLAYVEAQDGRLRIDALSRHSGLSPRSIDRLFRRHLGIAPKVYTQIVRFQRCLARLKVKPKVPLSRIAIDAGYYDQSHFVRDYRRFAGTTPVLHKGYFPADAPTDFSANLVQFVQDTARR